MQRRAAVTLGLAGPLAWVFAVADPVSGEWWALPSAVVTGLLAAAVLASYVAAPGSGRTLELGCSPCAAAAAGTIVGALILRTTSPADPGMALVGIVLIGFGLVGRLSAPVTCAVPAQRADERRRHDGV